jgi:hypothetical protein
MFPFIRNLQQFTLFGMVIAVYSNGKVCKDLNKPQSSSEGREPMGLIESKMADLPKDEPTVCSTFFYKNCSVITVVCVG